MNYGLLLLARAVGLRRPTVDASRIERDAVMPRALTRVIKQGGRDCRPIQKHLSALVMVEAAGFVVGLAGPPYGLPPTDPTPDGFARHRCRGQLDGDRHGRRRLLRDLPPSLTDRGRLTPTTNPRVGNSPLTPFPSAARQTGDAHSSNVLRTVRSDWRRT
jgi:hypothetical protein